MKRTSTLERLWRLGSRFLMVGLMAGGAQASTNIFDFDSDPSSLFSSISRGGDNSTLSAMAGVWISTDGSPLQPGVVDQSTNGYFAITQTTPSLSAHGMRSAIVFSDFDNGLIMAGFTFSCDLRLGAGSGSPADGFSLNYARAGDPAITGGTFGSSPGGTANNAPEEGTTTGLALSFDAYNNGSGDVVGLTIKVDNTIITNIPMATLNGACDDPTSMQTGPNNGGVAGLCWQPLWVNLDPTNGLLNVMYKGVALVTNYSVQFAPSPGRLIFAGRTGGSYQEQDVDNIRIVTVPSPWPVVGPVSGKANGWRFTINDSGFATPDINTITVTCDGVPVTPLTITQTGSPGAGDGATMVSYENPGLLFAAGSKHTNHVHFTGSTFTGAVDKDIAFTIPAYATLDAAQQAPGLVDTNITDGFFGRIHQLPVPRTPDALSFGGMEKELADGYIDPATGKPYESVDPVSSFTNLWLNWSVDAPAGGRAGYFSMTAAPDYIADDPVPGIDWINDLSTTNIAAEILSVLYLPVGAYQLGVTHDDGVKITVGPEPRDAFATALGSVTSTAEIGPANIAVTKAGYYPVRLLWGQGGGAANLEFFAYDWATGQRMLINDRSKPTSITAYAAPRALTLPYVRWVSPARDETGVLPTAHIIAKLEDGSAGTITSASLIFNGVLTVGTKSGSTTTADFNPGRMAGGLHTATLIYKTSLGASVTNTWDFTVTSLTLDKTHSYVGIGQGAAVQSADRGGHTGGAGDYAIDLGSTGSGNSILITDAAFLTALNAAHANDIVTYSMWVKLRSNANNSLFWAYTPSSGNRAVNLHYPWGNTVYFDTGGYDNTLNRISKGITSFPPYQVVGNDTWWTNWHHVVAIKNGSSDIDKWIYIDGVQLVAGANTAALLSNVTSLNLGSANGNANAVRGLIDDFSVYATALSEGDISALASGTAPDAISAKDSLIAYWPFDEAPPAPPSISVTREGGLLTIRFVGTLQACSAVSGTYVDVVGASSPYIIPAAGPQMFYRTRQ